MEEEIKQPEAKKTEKEERRLAAKRKNSTKKILYIGIAVVVLIILVYWVSSSNKPQGENFSISVPFEGDEHVSEDTVISYNSNPPTSGSHWATSLADGIYQEEKPDQAAIHSMEHGRIWISYHPDIPQETKEKLETLLKGQGAIVLTPRSQNDTDIALAAWTRLDKFDLNPDGTFDEERILGFIKRYRHKGPEFLPNHGGGSIYQNWTPES